MGKKEKYVEESEGITTWEDDQEDETLETKIVKAPNNKRYMIRVISAYDRQKIQSVVTEFQMGTRGRRGAKMEMKTTLMNALTLQKAVVKPDFSKRSSGDIQSWMKRKKDGVVTFLMDQIAILSGYSPEDQDEAYFRDEQTK